MISSVSMSACDDNSHEVEWYRVIHVSTNRWFVETFYFLVLCYNILKGEAK